MAFDSSFGTTYGVLLVHLISVPDGAQPVRDDDHGLAGHQLMKVGVDDRLVDGVQGRGGFVDDQDLKKGHSRDQKGTLRKVLTRKVLTRKAVNIKRP